MATIIRGPGFAILSEGPSVRRRPEPVELRSQVDGFLSESHEVRLSKTTYPIESGQSLTDHAVVEPRTLKLDGWVSGLLIPVDRSRPLYADSREAWDALVRLMESRQPMRVITTLGVYDDMLITSLKAPVDRTTGRALRFEMELEEVLFRDLQRGTAPPPERSGPAEDRPEETDRGRIQAPAIEEQAAILAEISAEIASGLPTDMPAREPSVWDRILMALGVKARRSDLTTSVLRRF